MYNKYDSFKEVYKGMKVNTSLWRMFTCEEKHVKDESFQL